jgi:branched-chain amino acid transport system permease protein
VSSVLAGLSGMLFVLQFNTLTPDLGHAVELKGLAAIIIGGMTSVTGAAAGGLLLGLVEVGTTVGLGAGWKDIAAFGAIFVVLLARPKGLFGVRAAREV